MRLDLYDMAEVAWHIREDRQGDHTGCCDDAYLKEKDEIWFLPHKLSSHQFQIY